MKDVKSGLKEIKTSLRVGVNPLRGRGSAELPTRAIFKECKANKKELRTINLARQYFN